MNKNKYQILCLVLIFFACGTSNDSSKDDSVENTIEITDEISNETTPEPVDSSTNFTNVPSEPLSREEKRSTSGFHYDLNNPLNTLPLSSRLVEISGLSYYPKTNQLMAVNDELGNIYFVNPASGKIDKTIDFGSRGDYEGLELVGTDIYVVKSNGMIYIYDLAKNQRVKPQRTKLNSSNNIEGLGYDPEKNELLIACKGNWEFGSPAKSKKYKAVYRFDLKDGKLKKQPVLKIDDDDLEKFVKDHFDKNKFSKKEISNFKNRANSLAPSGIAVHPITRDYYILSSAGKLLIVVDQNKKLKKISFLNDRVHRQPEAICFTPQGDLFIGNEGRGFSAKIHFFKAKNL